MFTLDRIYVTRHHIDPQIDLGSDLGLWSAYSFHEVVFWELLRITLNRLAYNHWCEIYRAFDQNKFIIHS